MKISNTIFKFLSIFLLTYPKFIVFLSNKCKDVTLILNKVAESPMKCNQHRNFKKAFEIAQF